ncbi:MAG: AIR synthase related protein [Kiritimatiellaeota bacterium]|nr:AIR synthase related protein [Kiritimatiellota bacterium]
MNEYDIIRAIAAKYPRSPSQLNQLFECDSELLKLGGQVWGLTMDEFSPTEDLFTSDDPALLGANLTVATLSDLLAAGAEPKFFMHAVSLPHKATPAFIEGLAEGIGRILKQADCALLGGDLGTAESWRYCGFAMGPVVAAKPLTHRLPSVPQTLWITGELGDANLAALQRGPTPAFQLRLPEAVAIRQHATACIDTSGGLMDALWILHELNPAMRFELHAEKIPLASGIREFSKTAGIPAEAALLGGAGEYELLFATPSNLAPATTAVLTDLGMTPIADVTANGTAGIQIFRQGRPVATMTDPPPCPRAAGDTTEHIKAVIAAAGKLFGAP